ncbi:hypothetical protein [Bacillus sp. ISL-46]|uniref:hypothetical protein n=1 Tax=Bacillus sp. ISL-46 TaxID=2819129 RepID=UPI001BE99989|nr:hypothetical protein [Bacillus sp. ISL-46]MBT2724362.1 hypothetical protein [Bacillus sp. ISL-46]
MRRFAYLLIFLLLNGCASTEPPSTTEMKKFIDDTQYMIKILESAYSEGMRELTYEEEREAVAYEANYDKSSDFQKKTDDPSISLIVSNLSLMKLTLGNTGTVVGDNDPKMDFLKYRSDVGTELTEAKSKYIEEN